MGIDEKRHSPQTGKTIVVALMVFALCAFGSVIFAAYQREPIDRFLNMLNSLRKPAPATPLLPPRGVKKSRVEKPLVFTSWLASPNVVFRDDAFTQADTFTATDFCKVLGTAIANLQLQWSPNGLLTDTFDCAGVLTVSAAIDSQVHNSLFVQTRRNLAGGTISVRLKLVHAPERMEQDFKPDFERAAELILSLLLGNDAVAPLDQLRRYTPFTTEIRGISMKFFEEQMSPGAFNLMVEARCGKYRCQAANQYYKLNQPLPERTPLQAQTDTQPGQQE